MPPFDKAHITSQSPFTETMHLSWSVFKKQCIICWKSEFLPTYIWRPLEFQQDVWHRVPRLPCSIVCMIIRLAGLILVTDNMVR